ncbi:hypothetical protein HAZT_HAZT010746 [Hyalella azteca]|uniref:Peptidase M14 domain-containing protein n=1 Tax=Hyalella azteca TaxID=294128 RepID=A0A6A0GX27_HYAAZ|nr:hypothetical protein HAZT_HAZT010746 [Hyalella azteca]
MHAREWLSTATALHLIETLLEDHEATRGVEWRVVPVLNPDGYFYTWNKDRLWRKNRRPIASNRCVGVDLNRNFGVDFGGKGASQFPCSDEYHGTSAFSEPETRALRDAVNDAGERLKAYVSLHSYRQSILLPWAHSPKSHANAQNLTNMAHGIARAISELRGTKFEVDTAWFNLYPASGTSADWAADVDVPYSFIFELQDEGEHGFLWPESEIASAVNETYCGIKFMGKVIRKIFSPSEFLTQEDEDFSLVDVEMPADREPTTENGLALLLQIYEEVLSNQNQINNKNMAINLTVEQEPGLIKIKVPNNTATPTEEKPVGSLSISVKNKTHVDEQQAAGIVIQVRNPQAELPSHAVDVKASKSQIYERQPVQDTKDVNRSAAGEESSNSSSGKDDECADDVDCKSIYERYGRNPEDTWLSVLDESYSQGRYARWQQLSTNCGSTGVDVEQLLSDWFDDGMAVLMSEDGTTDPVEVAVAPPLVNEAQEKLRESNCTASVVAEDLEKISIGTINRKEYDE